MYAEMAQHLDYDQSKEGAYEAARAKLDNQLKIKRWRVGWEQEDPYQDVVADEGAPWWWDGDEEASSTFLDSMGVQLDKG